MKREDVYNAVDIQVNREIFPVKMSLSASVDRQIEKIQIEQTMWLSKRSYTIFEAMPHVSHMKYAGIQLEDISKIQKIRAPKTNQT